MYIFIYFKLSLSTFTPQNKNHFQGRLLTSDEVK